jgi:formamidopyrimidine-DNA glycosylase
MKSRFAVFLLTLFLLLVWFDHSSANVDWEVWRTFKLNHEPLDVAVSINGKSIFILTENGELIIYSHNGMFKGKISVGNSVDKIKPGPKENILFLSSRRDKTVQIITLDFIQDINVSGSPFKGPVDASVVIVVFDDFQ